MRYFFAIFCAWLAFGSQSFAGSFAPFQASGYVAPSGSTPIVTNATFSPSTPASSGGTVGTVSATNTPTSWSITAGNSSGDFAMSNSGVITFTATGQTDWNGSVSKKTATLTVQATNASGNGSGIVDVNGYADGSISAAAATAPFPSLLSGYAVPPPQKVAGVAYGVGVPTATSLTDWQSISQTGVSVNTGTGQVTVNCSGGAVTLTGIDFTLHGGAFILDATNNCNVTVTNSKFGNTPLAASYTIHIQTTNANLTVTNCDFTGGNTNYGAFIGYQATGTLTFKYNYAHLGAQHVIEQVSGVLALIYKYNTVYDMAVNTGAHNNWMQWGTIGSGSTADIEFNTAYQDNPEAGRGEGFQFYANSSGTLGATTLGYNTMIAVPFSGSGTMSYIIHGGTASGTDIGNYFDITGAFGAYYPSSITTGAGWSCSGDVNMSTGASLTPC